MREFVDINNAATKYAFLGMLLSAGQGHRAGGEDVDAGFARVSNYTSLESPSKKIRKRDSDRRKGCEAITE